MKKNQVQFLAFFALCLGVLWLMANFSPSFAAEKTSEKSSPAKSESKNELLRFDFQNALLDFESDRAIVKLVPHLNRAMAAGDNRKAARIMRLIAIALRFDENDVSALQAAEIALKLDPQDAGTAFQISEYRLRAGDAAGSEQVLAKLSKSKNRQLALKARAYLLQQTGNIAAAESLFQEYLALVPDDMRALNRLSQLQFVSEQKNEAAEIQTKLAQLSLTAYMREIHLGRAQEALAKGASLAEGSSLFQAERHYQKAGLENPNDPLWHMQLALLYMKTQRIKQADLEFRRCFSCRRLLSQAYTNFALMTGFFADKKEAFDALSHLAKLRPSSSELYFVRGILCEKDSDLERATENFQRAAELNPRNSNPYIHLLDIAKGMKNKQTMLELCRNWSENCPYSATALTELGLVFESMSQTDKAQEAFLKARNLLKGRKTPTELAYRIAVCKMHARLSCHAYYKKEMQEALAEAIEFNKLRPEAARAGGLSVRPERLEPGILQDKRKEAAEHALIADVLFEIQDYTGAEKEYRLAIEADPQNISYHSCLLKVLLDKKDYAAAAMEDAVISQHVVSHIPDMLKGSKN